MALQGRSENELSLAAALATDDVALAAWIELMEYLPFDEVNINTQRLAPIIFNNLRHYSNVPERERLRGTYKYHWAKTTQIIYSIAPLLQLLDQASINYRIIKGLAIQLSQRTVGARIMADCDIVIKEKDAQRAVEIIESLGFRPKFHAPCNCYPSTAHFYPPTGYIQGLSFTHGKTELDLHVAESKFPKRLLGRMLDHPPELVRWGSLVVCVPNQELLTLHAIVHGERANGPSDLVQAVSDVVQLSRTVDIKKIGILAKELKLEGSVANFRRLTDKASFKTPYLSLPNVGHFKSTWLHTRRAWLQSSYGPLLILRQIRARRSGRKIVVDFHNQSLFSRILYRIWLYTGQIVVLERWICNLGGRFMRKPQAAISDGLIVAPFTRDFTNNQLSILRVAQDTLDWRFRIRLPVDSKRVMIRVHAEALSKLDFTVIVNGVVLCDIFGDDPNTHVVTIQQPRTDLEISLRPLWDACPLCFSKLNSMELKFNVKQSSDQQ